MRRHRFVGPGAVATAVVVGVVAGIAVRGTPAPATPRPPAVSTATVVRTDLDSTVLTAGTLEYSATNPLINRVAGTYTDIPPLGARVGLGQVLYGVDDLPVVFMTGTIPAWRPFTAGMSDGPDVRQLEANLIGLGDAHGLFSVASDHFSAAASEAVKRWQIATGYPANGEIALGVVVFFPGPILVGAPNVALGQGAVPGDLPYAVSGSTRTVSVPLTPNDPPVNVGQAVSIVLPSNASTPGHVAAIGFAPSSNGVRGPSGSTSQASTVLTVTPDHPIATGTGSGIDVQVALTIQSVRDVLAAPVSSLLALAGGGYGVETVPASGPRRLIGVRTGAFAGGRVQVTGSGIAAGTKVVVAQ